jgi:hypothetical protein
MASFREIKGERYFRLNYDNDYFAATDHNYTQGYSFELVAPSMAKNPINHILLKHKVGEVRAGIAFEHLGYTPKAYEKLPIQVGDRPFAAVAMLKSFTISLDTVSKSRISSNFSFGIMGKEAFGQEIQAGIHRLTGDRVPYGWVNQLESHFMINYGVDYEKEIYRHKNAFALYGNAAARIGTIFTNASIGATTTFGIINSPYTSQYSTNKFQVYGYIQPIVTAVVYDATLQGGLIGDNSVYTIPAGDVNRVTGQVNYGIVLQIKKVYLEYSRANISKEIKTLVPAGWGGVRIGFNF